MKGGEKKASRRRSRDEREARENTQWIPDTDWHSLVWIIGTFSALRTITISTPVVSGTKDRFPTGKSTTAWTAAHNHTKCYVNQRWEADEDIHALQERETKELGDLNPLERSGTEFSK